MSDSVEVEAVIRSVVGAKERRVLTTGAKASAEKAVKARTEGAVKNFMVVVLK
jgi:hypothetical protein